MPFANYRSSHQAESIECCNEVNQFGGGVDMFTQVVRVEGCHVLKGVVNIRKCIIFCSLYLEWFTICVQALPLVIRTAILAFMAILPIVLVNGITEDHS